MGYSSSIIITYLLHFCIRSSEHSKGSRTAAMITDTWINLKPRAEKLGISVSPEKKNTVKKKHVLNSILYFPFIQIIFHGRCGFLLRIC